MKVTACELEDGWFEEETNWNRLIEYVGGENSDLVLLPEMPFSRWLARAKDVDPEKWRL
jgi:N-carbamoylputrescine amidase